MGLSSSMRLRLALCALLLAAVCVPASAELRAFIIHGGDTPAADLGWISAICQTFKALTKNLPASRVVLYTKAQPKQIDHACKFGIENQTLSTEYEWTKQDVLDALRFYSYNHNVMLFLFGHGHLPEEKATLRSRVLWNDRVSWDEARTFNVSLAGAHPEHVQLIRRSTPEYLKRQGLEFYEYSRAKFKTVVASRATDLMASHGPAHRSPGFLETMKELEYADTAPNIGSLTVYPSEKRAGVPDVVGPNDRLIRGADIIALGQPWTFLTVIAFHDYSGGMFDIFRQNMVKNKIVLFSPTLPYTPTDFVISTDQNVRLIGRLFEARDQDLSLLRVFKNYLLGCKTAWTETGAKLDPKYPVRRCTAHPPVLKQIIVKDPLSHNVKVSFERDNAAALDTIPVATVLRDFPTQAVTINLRRTVGGKWHSLIVQPSWSLADFKAAAAAALDYSAYAKSLVSNNYGVSGPKFGLNCFVTGTDGRAVAVNTLILKSMRNKSVVTCTLPFTPNISPPADNLTPFSVTA